MHTYLRPLTQLLGVVLTIVGIAGFFTDGLLFLFEVDPIHNSVHLLSGLVALAASRSEEYSRWFLMVFGMIYAVVALSGFLWNGNIPLLFHTNRADDFLHAAIAIAALTVGFSGNIGLGKKR